MTISWIVFCYFKPFPNQSTIPSIWHSYVFLLRKGVWSRKVFFNSIGYLLFIHVTFFRYEMHFFWITKIRKKIFGTGEYFHIYWFSFKCIKMQKYSCIFTRILCFTINPIIVNKRRHACFVNTSIIKINLHFIHKL